MNYCIVIANMGAKFVPYDCVKIRIHDSKEILTLVGNQIKRRAYKESTL